MRRPLRSARQAGGLKVHNHRENKGRRLLRGLGDWGVLIEKRGVSGVLDGHVKLKAFLLSGSGN